MMALGRAQGSWMAMRAQMDAGVRDVLGLAGDVAVTPAHRDAAIARLVRRAGKVPDVCDRAQIIAAPARGPVLGFWPKESYTTATGQVLERRSGRYAALKVQDAFDKAAVAAARTGQPDPFTDAQRDAGRTYGALFHRCASSGLKLSSLEGGSGGGGAGGVSEAVLDDLQMLRFYDRRIGRGVSMAVRRVRPSLRGAADGMHKRNITDARLVHLFCVDGETISGVLVAHGWADRGKARLVVRDALRSVLDRLAW